MKCVTIVWYRGFHRVEETGCIRSTFYKLLHIYITASGVVFSPSVSHSLTISSCIAGGEAVGDAGESVRFSAPLHSEREEGICLPSLRECSAIRRQTSYLCHQRANQIYPWVHCKQSSWVFNFLWRFDIELRLFLNDVYVLLWLLFTFTLRWDKSADCSSLHCQRSHGSWSGVHQAEQHTQSCVRLSTGNIILAWHH